MRRVRADFRPLGNHGHVGIAQRIAALAQQHAAMAQEHATVGSAPAFVARRKVLADVAECERAEQRVAERMDDHVTVGMRDDALRVRNRDHRRARRDRRDRTRAHRNLVHFASSYRAHLA